jgi:hypothetical protein
MLVGEGITEIRGDIGVLDPVPVSGTDCGEFVALLELIVITAERDPAATGLNVT